MILMDFYGLRDYIDGDADTEYTSAEFAEFLAPLVGTGICDDGSAFDATANGLVVTLAAGQAFACGRMGKTATPKTVELEPVASGTSRIDRIVISLDIANQQMGIDVVQGIQSASPSAPALTQSDSLYQLPLWQALVNEDATITLTDQRRLMHTVNQMQDWIDSKAAASHTHAQSDVSGLATALAGKAAASHAHTQSDVSGLSNALAGKLSTDQKGAANGVATLDGNGRVTAEQASAFPMSIFAGRTLSLSDAGKFLYANTSSAITITVPADETVNFPDGTEIEICRWYTGAVSIAAASGVYLCSVNDKRSIANRWGVVCLKKIASNAWLLAGDLG